AAYCQAEAACRQVHDLAVRGAIAIPGKDGDLWALELRQETKLLCELGWKLFCPEADRLRRTLKRAWYGGRWEIDEARSCELGRTIRRFIAYDPTGYQPQHSLRRKFDRTLESLGRRAEELWQLLGFGAQPERPSAPAPAGTDPRPQEKPHPDGPEGGRWLWW